MRIAWKKDSADERLREQHASIGSSESPSKYQDLTVCCMPINGNPKSRMFLVRKPRQEHAEMRSPSILTYEEVRACRFAGGGRGKANESFRLLVAFFIQEYVQIDGQTERQPSHTAWLTQHWSDIRKNIFIWHTYLRRISACCEDQQAFADNDHIERTIHSHQYNV